ncbi:hypothetical protein ACWD5V_09175 [Streptomyces sp. NPDC002523]
MTVVIVAGVLGVITICGGLFLRRLFGELAELRRQITWVDRQMRAQRARVTFLRQLITEDDEIEDRDGDGPPQQAAVANGHDPELSPTIAVLPTRLGPVRHRRHLRLYSGGAVTAALVTIGTAAREASRQHRSHVAAAVTGTLVTTAAVTLVTVQPWAADADQQTPPSAPPAVSSPAYAPQSAPGRTAPPASPTQPSTSESLTTPPAVPESLVLTAKPAHQRAAKSQGRGGKRTVPPGHTQRPATQPPSRATPPPPGPPGSAHRQERTARPTTPSGRSDLSPNVKSAR